MSGEISDWYAIADYMVRHGDAEQATPHAILALVDAVRSLEETIKQQGSLNRLTQREGL